MQIIDTSYLYLIIINKFIFKELIFIVAVLTNIVLYIQCIEYAFLLFFIVRIVLTVG